MRVRLKSVLIGLLPHLVALTLRAETISVPLGDSSFIETDSSNAVVNPALQYVHPPLQVQNWDSGGGPETTPLVFGTGVHGPFNASTYLNFHEGTYNNDGVIQINTDRFPILDVTEFHLEAGWVIKPVGSQPLVIRSLSKVEIHGVIDCSGEDGEAPSEDLTISPPGGAGRCGGANGGRGGSLAATVEGGSAPTTNTNAGGGAANSEGGGGGGGAGMDMTAPAAGTGVQLDGITPSGAAGTSGNDTAFEKIGGGGGGGGGELYNNALDPVTLHASGGGGGAGGGSIYIHAIQDVVITGRVLANGGKGGGSASARKGGGGGGGAGGSIQIFAGGDLLIDGDVEAVGGAGGTTAGGVGGDGGSGRIWVSDSNGAPTVIGGTFDPMPIILVFGDVNFQIGAFDVVSSLIDSRSSAPEFNSASVDATVSGASSVTLEVAASETPFDVASAQWIPATSISSLNGLRYLRFRLRIDNQSVSDPVIVRSISLEYKQSNHGRFEFGSCQMVAPITGGSSHSGTPPWSWFLIPLAPLLLWLRLRAAAVVRVK